MAKIIELPIEPLTEENFAPFGQLLGERKDKPHYQSATARTWDVKFEIEGKVELEYATFAFKPVLEFTRIERHYNVTQAFFPLGNDASVTVFGAPTDPDDRDAWPKPESLKALFIDGTQGIMMWKGTWHSGRFPAQKHGARFAFLTDAYTTSDLTAMQTGKGGRLNQIADYSEKGINFRLTDPRGLMK